MVALTLLGGGWSALALLPMIWHARTRLFAKVLAIAIAVQASLVWGIKLAVGRVRPWIVLGLAPPIGSPCDGSFPSGHASGSFCAAAFVAIALPAAWQSSPRLSRVIGVLAVLLASLIALSRVYLAAHFPSDALAGAALGMTVGVVAAARYGPRARAPGGRGPPKADEAVESSAKRG